MKARAKGFEAVSAEVKKLEEDGKDIDITCKSCSTKFTHTVADQIRFATRQWENLPASCQKCKENEPKGPCFDFAAGKCNRGDKCKFVHSDVTSHHISANLGSTSEAEDDEDDSDSDSIDLDCY